MANNKINVDDGTGLNALSEFFRIVDQIAEKTTTEKSFPMPLLNSIFKTAEIQKIENEIIEKLGFNIPLKIKIRKEKLNILSLYRHNKKEIEKIITDADILKISEKDIIESWHKELANYKTINEAAKYAILIEIYAEKAVKGII